MAGEAERLLGRFCRRYAATVRVATVVPIAAIAPLRADDDVFTATVLVMAAAVLWTAGQAWWLRRTERVGPVVVALDVAVLLGLATSVLWTDAVDGGNTGWLRLLITFACLTWQWYTPPLTGAVAVVVTAGGWLAILIAADAPADLERAAVWVLVVAALSRLALVLVTRAARRADRIAAEAARAGREAAVAAAVRAEERELVTSLHDTAATTLLMVGVGQVPPGTAWLAPQARRDLERMRSHGGQAPERADLVDLLRADLDAGHLTVDVDAPPRLSLPFDVAGAVAGAAGEALNNVRRHAGTDRATVRVTGNESEVSVEVADDGTGFAANGGRPAGRGLRESVHGRMARIGGTATVTSAEGAGTVVRLKWRAPA
ncbi:sensor histidine kinase [Actinophytocola sp. NPDC049390]|uniref:sensor histidine kinase n=1 Tax=Actinophytocola sp. NPDC049390 TaxID=3363894 RepID=UPI0037B7CB8A